MKRRLKRAALAALFASVLTPMLVPAGTAIADGAADATGFTIASSAEPTLASQAPSGEQKFVSETRAEGTLLASAYMPATTYRYSRYRPRRERPRSYYREPGYSRIRGVAQIHAGFLDPDGAADPGFVVGFRGGQQMGDMLQIGLGVDWRTKTGRSTEVLQEQIGPGGEVIQVRRDLSSFSSNLFPTLAYLQLSGPSNLGIVPYFGVAGSWQVLFLQADDFQTGESFDATFDGFGWQLWGGAAMPLGGGSKLVGEVFLNNADLSRDVFDPASGQTIREIVSTDGVGARFGVSVGF